MKNSIVKIVSVIMALSLVMLNFAACGDKPNYEQSGDVSEITTTEPTETTTEGFVTTEKTNPLTGLEDLSDSAIGARPIAIMVENSPEARPQWGITTPDIVVEGVVEGGVTRMMWIYADAEDIPDKVGPVRSARHDYVELAKGLNAIYVHWGGSDGAAEGYNLAYQKIKSLDMDNIDGMKYENVYFFRDKTRSTSIEHRGITSGESIKKAISKLGYSTKQTKEDWLPYKIGSKTVWGGQESTGPCSSISVTFSQGYTHTFTYNATEKKYYNYLNNKVMTDGNNGEEMAIENIIVIYAPVKTLNTKKHHKEWNLEVENGEGFYVANGVGQKIYWSKDGASGALKLKGVDGKELNITPGKVWLGVVPKDNQQLTSVKE